MDCIEILAAAWGPHDVTEKLWSIVKKDDKIEATDSTFGTKSGGEKYQKYLVVCYQYPGIKPALLIMKENESRKISSMGILQDQPENELSCSPSGSNTLSILGAAWGGDDVTEHAQKLASEEKLNERSAINELWEKPNSKWYSGKKILVVVYQYSDIPMMSIVKEKEMIYLTSSPPLFIIGAVHGCEIVTNDVQKFVKNHELHIKPKLDLPANPGLNSRLTYLSFVMVYQYGNEEPILYISSQSSDVNIRYVKPKEVKKALIVDPNQLVILGAAYGLKDVTEKMQKNVSENAGTMLEIPTINNTTVGMGDDEWKMYYKTLVVIYRYGTGLPKISITKQDENIKIEKMLPQTFGGLVDSKNLVCNNDEISLIAVNNKYVSHASDSGKLVASSESVSSCKFTVVQPISNGPYFLKEKQTQKFCEADDKGFLVLKGDQGKTGFMLTLSMSGKVKLATSDNKFVHLVDKQFLKAESIEHFSATTSFQLEVNCSPTTEVIIEAKTSNEKMWFEFVWQVTEGFFLTLGFEPFLGLSKPKSIELLHFLRGFPNISKALKMLRDEARSTTNETDAMYSAIRFIATVWKEGLLWMVFKFLRFQEGTIVYTEIFAQVVQVLLLPESEARIFLSGFTTWAIQLMATSKKLQDL